MLSIVLPGQLLGNFAAIAALTASGVLRDRPGLGVLAVALGALVAGVGVGLLLRPHRDQLLGYALVGAAVGIAAFLLLFGLAQVAVARDDSGRVGRRLPGAGR